MSERKRRGVQQAAKGATGSWQSRLFDEEDEPEWVEVDTKRVRVEGVRDFGGYWLGLEVADKLGLITLLEESLPEGREDIPWSLMAMTLALMRLCEPSSDLRIAEQAIDVQRDLREGVAAPPAGDYSSNFRNTMQALIPPKPKLLDSTDFTSFFRAAFGT